MVQGRPGQPRAPHLISNGRYYKFACSDAETQARVLRKIGFSAKLVKYTLDTAETFKLTASFDCESGPQDGGAAQYRYYASYKEDATPTKPARNLYYVYDMKAKKVFVLGCQALVDALGFSGVKPTDDPGASFIGDAKINDDWEIVSLNCLKGKEINPLGGIFGEDTLKDQISSIESGTSKQIKLEINGLREDQKISYAFSFNTDKACPKEVVWATLSNAKNNQLIIGTKPTLTEFSCVINLSANVDGVESDPLPITVISKPKTFGKSWEFPIMTCSSTSEAGEVTCWNKSDKTIAWKIESQGKAVKDIVQGIYYVCALYDKDGDNLVCKYHKNIPAEISAKQPRGHVKALAGTVDQACASVVDGTDTGDNQILHCWEIDPDSEVATTLPQDGRALHGNTRLSLSVGGAVCYDFIPGSVEGRRNIECKGLAAFSNVQPTPSNQEKKPEFNIADVNATGSFDLDPVSKTLDLATSQSFGCAILSSKVGCWGIKDDSLLAEDAMSNEYKGMAALRKISTAPGSLRIKGDYICVGELSKESTKPETTIHCLKKGAPTLDAPIKVGAIKFYDIDFTDGKLVACWVNILGSQLSCSNEKKKSLKDLAPEGGFWDKKLDPI
ncbi:MAG: hypothetical protein H7318_14945 [Oligoflexus sp.]|nr:hypothetical protein [Oligoflexus sp.]